MAIYVSAVLGLLDPIVRLILMIAKTIYVLLTALVLMMSIATDVNVWPNIQGFTAMRQMTATQIHVSTMARAVTLEIHSCVAAPLDSLDPSARLILMNVLTTHAQMAALVWMEMGHTPACARMGLLEKNAALISMSVIPTHVFLTRLLGALIKLLATVASAVLDIQECIVSQLLKTAW